MSSMASQMTSLTIKYSTIYSGVDQRKFTTVFFHALFYSTLIPMFTVLDPLLEITYHLLFSWGKFALSIQSLLCMLFLFGWPPCQRSDMILMEVSQHAYDMIHYISGLFGYFSVCEIYVNLIWHLYLFMLNKFCLSLSLSLKASKLRVTSPCAGN